MVMPSLHGLPVEVLLLIEVQAKGACDKEDDQAPSLQLSWVCRHLRAVFMPRFWSFVVIGSMRSLARLVKLIRSSPSDTFRQHVKYLAIFNIGDGLRLDARLYTMDPTPSAGDHLSPSRKPIRTGGDFSVMCGPRLGETWPTPTQLAFNDPKRYFKLAGRRRERDIEYESDETGSSAASEAEEEERKCTVCHPVMHKLYRHRVKPDDYWLPGAVHSIGPLEWNRRTWGRYRGPDQEHEEPLPSMSTVTDFVQASTFLLEQLNIETLDWSTSFQMPRQLCEKLAQHPTFHRLGVSGLEGGKDSFSLMNSRGNLLLLASRLTALEEVGGTAFGDRELSLRRDEEDNLVYLPLSDYPEGNSMRGFMDFLLAAKKLKHLNAECKGVFVTSGLLGVFAKLHSLHWDTLTSEPDQHVVALSKLRSSLWKLAEAVGRPDYLLEAVDVQLLADSSGEHAELAAELAPLSDWLEQEELATLVAQGWNEQEERGPNESAVFYPPCLADSTSTVHCSTIATAYEHPTSLRRL